MNTEKKDKVGFDFLVSYYTQYGQYPTLQKICPVIGVTSFRSAQLMLFRLQRQGLIKYVKGKISIPNGAAYVEKSEIKRMTERFVAAMIPFKDFSISNATIIYNAESMANDLYKHFNP